MKIRFAVAAGVAAVAVLVGLGVSTASATTIPVQSTCLTGWYVNPDEGGTDSKQGDRRPTELFATGLQFQGNDLVHHAVNLPVANLKPGTFVASPAPTLSSFFSVEVLNDNGSGYATLRWDAAQSKWNIGGTAFYDTNPLKLVTDHNKGMTVRSFGVGYVNTPNNGGKTVVTSVTFAGKTYSLVCKPRHTYTPKPPVTSTVITTNNPAPTTIKVPVTVPIKITVNPGQFAVTPNTSKGIDTGDGSLS